VEALPLDHPSQQEARCVRSQIQEGDHLRLSRPSRVGPVGDGSRGDLSHPFLPDLSTGIRASQGSILEDETELLAQLVHRIRRRSLRADYGPINIVLRRGRS
jgi:hypothetical protein